MTGFAPIEMLGQPAPEPLHPLLAWCEPDAGAECGLSRNTEAERGHGFLVHARHKLGHDLPAMARLLVLRDVLGKRIGSAVLFHPAEHLDALPHGVTGEDGEVDASLADLQDRLESLFEDFTNGGPTFGVLWIMVDQAHDLRKTHGAGACETMLRTVEKAMAHGLRPAEHMGRWGEDEFLVVSHERTPEMLAVHAQTLAGLARTADFRWWGDRVSLTVSIGAAQAERSGTLAELLGRAKSAMSTSNQTGGNRITPAPEGLSCSPS
jgi:diguanylate cyclase (GGDEF)-like protein